LKVKVFGRIITGRKAEEIAEAYKRLYNAVNNSADWKEVKKALLDFRKALKGVKGTFKLRNELQFLASFGHLNSGQVILELRARLPKPEKVIECKS